MSFSEFPPTQLISLATGFWFIGIVIYEYTLLKDVPWLPTYLGGPGNPNIWSFENDTSLEFLYQVLRLR